MDARAAATPPVVRAAWSTVRAAQVAGDALLSAALLPGRAAGAVRTAERLADAAVAALPVRAAGNPAGATGRIDEAFTAATEPAVGAALGAIGATPILGDALVAAALLAAWAVGVGITEGLAEATAIALLAKRTASNATSAALGIVDAFTATAAAVGAAWDAFGATEVRRDALVAAALLSTRTAHPRKTGAFADAAVALLALRAAGNVVGATGGVDEAFATAALAAVGAALVAVSAAEVVRDALVATALVAARTVGVRIAEGLADATTVAALPVRAAGDATGAALGVVDAVPAAAAPPAIGAARQPRRAAHILGDALVAAAFLTTRAVGVGIAEGFAEATAVAALPVRAPQRVVGAALGIVDALAPAAPPAVGAASDAIGATKVRRDALVAAAPLSGRAARAAVDATRIVGDARAAAAFLPVRAAIAGAALARRWALGSRRPIGIPRIHARRYGLVARYGLADSRRTVAILAAGIHPDWAIAVVDRAAAESGPAEAGGGAGLDPPAP